MKSSLIALMFLSLCLVGCTSTSSFPEGLTTEPSATPTRDLHPPEKIDRELERAIAEIAAAAKGKVGVGAVLLETGDAAYLNRHEPFAMQSVYKLPIAMCAAQMIDRGTVRFDSEINIRPEVYVRRGFHSPIRNVNPRGTVMRLDDVMRYSLTESDGSASDVILELVGGPAKVQEYLTSIGVTGMSVADSTKAISLDWDAQYRNSATPESSVNLLTKLLDLQAGLSEKATTFIFNSMSESVTGRHRIRRGMPSGAKLAHKTGTGGHPSEVPGYWRKVAGSNSNANSLISKTSDPAGKGIRSEKDRERRKQIKVSQNKKPNVRGPSNADPESQEDDTEIHEVTSATNDIGIITLPDGRHIVLAVYVQDSVADGPTREKVIADIARLVCERWTTGVLLDTSAI